MSRIVPGLKDEHSHWVMFQIIILRASFLAIKGNCLYQTLSLSRYFRGTIPKSRIGDPNQ